MDTTQVVATLPALQWVPGQPHHAVSAITDPSIAGA